MGIKLDKETSQFGQSYKNAVHELGQILCHRSQRVWMYSNFIFRLSNAGRIQKRILDMTGSFRNRVVQKRRRDSVDVKYLISSDENDDQIVYGKKRLAMLDLLIEAERNGTMNINGINEEVDTFMFEVLLCIVMFF